ncbi:hypothetical protein Syun_013979 [Stephania yunnanensis]|uniref:Uncharacterized protein n=1 Tax=Stephania yunnanensis TaxID=152371 RepID=A0AAP0P951_9MAGN
MMSDDISSIPVEFFDATMAFYKKNFINISTHLIAPLGNSLNQIVSIKLDGTNFSLRKSIVVPLIEGCGLERLFFGIC